MIKIQELNTEAALKKSSESPDFKNPNVNRILMAGNSELMIFGMRKEVVAELVSRGYEVYASFPKTEFGNGTDSAKKFGCTFIETDINSRGRNPFQDIMLFKHYMELLKQIKPDIVLTYTIKPNIYLGLACKLKKIPYVANITGLGVAAEGDGPLQRLTLIMYKVAMRGVQRIFFQNEENMRLFERNNIAPKAGMLIPGSGVNLERFSPMEYPSGEQVHFLYISRIMKNKGIEQYLDAAEIIKSRHPQTVFHILGLMSEKQYEPRINELCEKGVVVYHGLCDRVEDYHAISSCTVHPTFYPEGMSNVLLETCACARPAITTGRSGCREIIEDGVNGFICRENDTDSLVEQIERFLALSVDERREMGLKGRKKVEKNFDRKFVIRKYLDEIEKI